MAIKTTTIKNRVLTPVKSVISFGRDHFHETIRIRDKHQFEMKLHYPLEFESKVSKLDLECYIFLPGNLGVNRLNFSKKNFYDSLYTEIRLKTPSYELGKLMALKSGPFQKLRQSAEKLKAKQYTGADVEYRLRLFCCILQSAVKTYTEENLDFSDLDQLKGYVDSLLESAHEIVYQYRALKNSISHWQHEKNLIRAFNFGDEYISLLLEDAVYQAIERISDFPSKHTSSVQPGLTDFIKFEVGYREKQSFPTVPSDHDSIEYYLYRRSKLKQYMHSVLTLDTRKKSEGAFIEHLLFALAGGISMLFATSLLFISQSVYGAFTIPVFVVLVVSYMFKDRIKEVLRVYFSKLKSSYLYDHKTRIYRNSKLLMGLCRESFDYLTKKRVPERIYEIRHSNLNSDIENTHLNESTIRYRKQIRLNSSQIKRSHRGLELTDISDIIRFDLTDIARRMGAPDECLYRLDKRGIKKIRAQRVYHINMVLRYMADGRKTFYKRIRIVLNRRNIKRVEVVGDHEKFASSPEPNKNP